MDNRVKKRAKLQKVRREAQIKVNPAQRERSDRVPGTSAENVCAEGTHYEATKMFTLGIHFLLYPGRAQARYARSVPGNTRYAPLGAFVATWQSAYIF
jgi:hypothetical protein